MPPGPSTNRVRRRARAAWTCELIRTAAGFFASAQGWPARLRCAPRLSQPSAFRRRARRLHLRDAVCRVRHHLSIRDVAAAPADAPVLATRMAGVCHSALRRAQPPRVAAPRLSRVRAEPVHLPPCAPAGPRALVPHVGLPAGGRHHIPARVGVDPLQDRCRTFTSSRSPRSSSFTGWCGRRGW